MKVLVMSDTHKDLTHGGLAIRHMIKQGIDIVIHCGDHIDDAKKLEKQYPQLKFFYVPGNCDGWFFQEDEKIKVVNIEDKKVLITHGDHHNIKLNYNRLFEEVNRREADIGLCGHSHLAHIETQEKSGKMIVNPGSISLPRDSKDPSYAVLDIQKGKPIRVKMMRIIDKESTQKEL
ncbi:MAG TPA: metallophosphoesterase [Epulopiscium sp.]|nr:metallophosphoesterase [Candidatus Epulonipiscium sp.]